MMTTETITAKPAHQETFVLNVGPQHPATHGVLRIKLTMDGEYILQAEPVLGYIHRMHEKMGENRSSRAFTPSSPAPIGTSGKRTISLASILSGTRISRPCSCRKTPPITR